MKNTKYTKKDIIRMAEEEDVEFIRLQFCDIFGVMKNLAITVSQLEKAMNNECSFEGSNINGYGEKTTTDLFLHPDLDTFAIFPWRPQQGKVARLICDVYDADGNPYVEDSRKVLQHIVDKAAEEGYQFLVGPECEFFLFHSDNDGAPTTITHEQAGYYDVGPVDFAENVRRDIILNLEDMGFEIKQSFHEKAPGQHEVDFRSGGPLETADNLQTFKMTVKSIAKRHGLHATFMPKPCQNVDGSGMHLNFSLYDLDGNNLFYDEEAPQKISRKARCFMAGVLKHIAGITALTNPIVNSYKRLVTGFDAPVYATWSTKSVSLLRVPGFKDKKVKVELRSPDGTANPYLAFAAIITAGLSGIRDDLELADPVDENVSAWNIEKRRSLSVERLPHTMTEAVDALEQDEFLISMIGEETAAQYIKAKRDEWDDYRRQVTKWEIDKYLNYY